MVAHKQFWLIFTTSGKAWLRHSLIWILSCALFYTVGLTPQAQAQDIDTPVTRTGTLRVVHGDDFDHHRSRFFYYLEDEATQDLFEVFFDQIPTHHLRNGDKVRVHGKLLGREIIVSANSGGSFQVVASASVAAVSGAQPTLVLVANFRDASVSCSRTTIEQTMFTDVYNKSIDDFYQETSFGQTSFNGDVYGPYTIDYYSTGTCDYYAWASAAEAAAQAGGVNLSLYTRRVYVLPSANSCGYIGLGTIGGNPSKAWIFRCDLKDVFGHELGHNLTAHHSSTPSAEYGDTSDIMGYSGIGLRHMNAPHKEELGWLSGGQVQAVTQNGTYKIAPLELLPIDTVAPQALKISKPDTHEYYYISYRRPLGFDVILSTSYSERVNVHRYPGSGSVFTYFLQALTDGSSFTDTLSGLTVTQVSHDATTATVQVGFTCTPAAPVVSLSPGNQSLRAGGTVNYAVTVLNKDTAACPQATMGLTPSVPAGWSGTLSPTAVALLPGATGTATFAVKAPNPASSGSNTVRVNVFDSLEALHTATASAIATIDDSAPSAPTNLKATVKGKQIQLTWTVSTDNVGVSSYGIWRSGVRIGTATGTSYTDTSTKRGTSYTYYVVATDSVGNSSAPSNSVTVQQ